LDGDHAPIRFSRSRYPTLSNVGPAVRRYFERFGITRVEQLAGRDPLDLYEEMCAADGQAHDRCLLDTVMSAVDQAGRQPARPWCHFTPQHKRLIAASRG